MAAETPDIFALLGLPASAEPDDVARAYRAQAVALHPDRHPDDAAVAERFRALTAAYATWSARRAPAPGAAAGAGATDPLDPQMFEGLFRDLFGAPLAGGGPRRGADRAVALRVSATEAQHGARRVVESRRAVECPTCDGSGAAPGSAVRPCAACAGRGTKASAHGMVQLTTACAACGGRGKTAERACTECRDGFVEVPETLTVHVPPGVQPGQRLRLAGKGDAGGGGAAGDLYIALEIAPSVPHTRRGDDAVAEVVLDAAQARDGARVTVVALDGDVEVAIPRGARDGAQVVVPQRGYPRGDDPVDGTAYRAAGPRGDLRVTVRVAPAPRADVSARAVAVALFVAAAAVALFGTLARL